MPESVRILLEETSQIGEARRAARDMAERMGFTETQTEQIAIVATEVCTNLIKHAAGGEILLRTTDEDSEAHLSLELLALDRGPGMDLEQCARDGFTTGTSPGEGIGAIIRLSPSSDFYSVPNKGSAVLARWPAPGVASIRAEVPKLLEIGAVHVSKHGQDVCGDAWGLARTRDYSALIVADGLGHGYDAHLASAEAVRIFHLHEGVEPKSMIERIHQALRSSRGAAVAVARIDHAVRKVTFSGVGNISAQIYSAHQPSQHLVSVNGTAGQQVNSLREFSYAWPDDGVLILNSDGLSTRAALDLYPRLRSRDASLIAGVLYRDFSRGHDDATVVVAKAA